MKFAVIQFPGSNCDQDCFHALRDDMQVETEYVWHKEESLAGYDAIVVPGGFSYGDYLRAGAIARFSPVMGAVGRAAEEGKLVIGVCNGFQILCESGLLPGAKEPGKPKVAAPTGGEMSRVSADAVANIRQGGDVVGV